jgi:hypothetical protein
MGLEQRPGKICQKIAKRLGLDPEERHRRRTLYNWTVGVAHDEIQVPGVGEEWKNLGEEFYGDTARVCLVNPGDAVMDVDGNVAMPKRDFVVRIGDEGLLDVTEEAVDPLRFHPSKDVGIVFPLVESSK